MISARPRISIKVTFLKHFAFEVWVSMYIEETILNFSEVQLYVLTTNHNNLQISILCCLFNLLIVAPNVLWGLTVCV